MVFDENEKDGGVGIALGLFYSRLTEFGPFFKKKKSKTKNRDEIR